MPSRKSSTGVVVALFLILLVVHQDFWFWGSDALVFGFMPTGLFYHAVYSIACALLGAIAIRLAWPVDATEDDPSA